MLQTSSKPSSGPGWTQKQATPHLMRTPVARSICEWKVAYRTRPGYDEREGPTPTRRAVVRSVCEPLRGRLP